MVSVPLPVTCTSVWHWPPNNNSWVGLCHFCIHFFYSAMHRLTASRGARKSYAYPILRFSGKTCFLMSCGGLFLSYSCPKPVYGHDDIRNSLITGTLACEGSSGGDRSYAWRISRLGKYISAPKSRRQKGAVTYAMWAQPSCMGKYKFCPEIFFNGNY